MSEAVDKVLASIVAGVDKVEDALCMLNFINGYKLAKSCASDEPEVKAAIGRLVARIKRDPELFEHPRSPTDGSA